MQLIGDKNDNATANYEIFLQQVQTGIPAPNGHTPLAGSLSRVIPTASAMGVPAVVTDIRGCREAVEHGVNGLLFPVGDTGSLAQSLIDLLQDDERRKRMGVAGRRIAEERFDEQKVFDRVLSEYERLLK